MFRRTLLAGLTALGLTIPAALASAQPLPLPTYSPNPMPVPQIIVPHQHHYHVEYRMPIWRDRSFGSEIEARRFESDLRARGFEVRHMHHRGHIDVRYRLMSWVQYGTAPSRLAARDMASALRGQGYQARIVPH